MKPESLAGVWEICDVRQRHIEIWWSVEIKVDCFRGCTGPRSQSVDETRFKRNSLQTLIPFPMNDNFQFIYSQTLRALAKRLRASTIETPVSVPSDLYGQKVHK